MRSSRLHSGILSVALTVGPLEHGHDPGAPGARGHTSRVVTLFVVTRAAVHAPRDRSEVPGEQHFVLVAHLADEPSRAAQLKHRNRRVSVSPYRA